MDRKIPRIPDAEHGADHWDFEGKVRRFETRDQRIVDFSLNTNPAGPPDAVLRAIRNHLDRIALYPDIRQRRLREAIARYVNVSADSILAGNGSTELIFLACDTLLGGKGTQSGTCSSIDNKVRLMIMAPSFGEYERAGARAGAEITFAFPDEGVLITMNALLKTVPEDGLVILCNPNNPTGQLWSKNQIEQLIRTAESKNTTICLDETFIELTQDPSKATVVNLVGKYTNLIVIRSLTKSFCIPGLRIGYLVSSPEVVKMLSTFQAPWSVNCFAETGTISALENPDGYLEEARKLILREREYLSSELQRIRGVRVVPSSANFLLVDIRGTGYTGRELKKKMIEEHGVLIRDCSSFNGLDQYWIRVAVKKHSENRILVKSLRESLSLKER